MKEFKVNKNQQKIVRKQISNAIDKKRYTIEVENRERLRPY
jgi:hypothetical protein